MSKATKRKHVAQEVMYDYVLPSASQQIVRVLASKGNNLHEVVTDSNEQFLVTMPSKFRKNVWIKRGDFVLVEPIKEGDRVKAEIINILYKNQIKYIKEEGRWPAGFLTQQEVAQKADDTAYKEDNDSEKEEESDDDDDLFVNTNRRVITYEESEDTDNEDGDEDELNDVEQQ